MISQKLDSLQSLSTTSQSSAFVIWKNLPFSFGADDLLRRPASCKKMKCELLTFTTGNIFDKPFTSSEGEPFHNLDAEIPLVDRFTMDYIYIYIYPFVISPKWDSRKDVQSESGQTPPGPQVVECGTKKELIKTDLDIKTIQLSAQRWHCRLAMAEAPPECSCRRVDLLGDRGVEIRSVGSSETSAGPRWSKGVLA